LEWDNFDGKIEDALVLLDIVSQYPAAMRYNKYPTGKPITKKFDVFYGTELAKTIMKTVLQNPKTDKYHSLKEKMFRTVFCVDINPPKDIFVAFLMSRDENKKNRQNLYRKTNVWYSGIEIFEAIKVGYTLEVVHGQVGFPSSKLIFSRYIDKLFQIKEANKADKSSVLYLAAKMLMNSLYGKFAQKIQKQYSSVVAKLPHDVERVWKGLSNFEISSVFNPDHTKIGYLVKADKDKGDVKVNYPSYISMCVVAYARRDMSKKMRSINGYSDPNNCYLYTDTDSVLLKKSAFDKLPGKYIGKELGQFENEFPNASIIAYRSLAPKTYCLCLLTKKDNKFTLAFKVRCKGIPHQNALIYKSDVHKVNNVRAIVKDMKKEIKDLRIKYYILHKRDESIKKGIAIPFLDIEIYDKCLLDNYTVSCVFGSIGKNKSVNSQRIQFSLKSIWVMRRLVLDNYWEKTTCDRIVKRFDDITTCKGNLADGFQNSVEDNEFWDEIFNMYSS
jgi:hypothetical protein